jgi:hypothetical protein
MDMQDKDLDKLFQSALNDYEMEPSAGVWKGITEGLDTNKKKRSLIPFLSVAAGVILLVTAGILFIPKEPKITKPQPGGVAAIKHPVKTSPAMETVAQAQPVTQLNKKVQGAVIAPVNSIANVTKNKIHKAATAIQPVAPSPAKDIARPDEQPVLAAAVHSQESIKPVVPDTATRIMVRPMEEKPVFASIKPSVVPVQMAVASKSAVATKKRKIRSLGDVFNVMIAAVDKRQDKFIQFSNTDGDDATITGVNLGIINIKKEK